MTEITVGLLGERAVRLSIQGHTGLSEEGHDVVCAAVSALVQALRFGFEAVLRDKKMRYTGNSHEPSMVLDWRDSESEPGNVLAETIIGSLKEIARTYPDNVRIMEVRVQ
jgi:uncharacterized protein YsxB (DUF464 family)